MAHIPEDNWRNDPGMVSSVEYKKKYAILPIICEDGMQVWLKNYYTKYMHWGHRSVYVDGDHCHTDKCENITEAEYIVRKLIEGF